MNNSERLPHFLYAAQVSIKAITALADWNIKFNQIVGIVWRSFSNIPLKKSTLFLSFYILNIFYLDSRATEHDTGHSPLLGGIVRNCSDINIAISPNSVFSQHFFAFIKSSRILNEYLTNYQRTFFYLFLLLNNLTYSLSPVINIIHQSNRQVKIHTTLMEFKNFLYFQVDYFQFLNMAYQVGRRQRAYGHHIRAHRIRKVFRALQIARKMVSWRPNPKHHSRRKLN